MGSWSPWAGQIQCPNPTRFNLNGFAADCDLGMGSVRTKKYVTAPNIRIELRIGVKFTCNPAALLALGLLEVVPHYARRRHRQT